MKKYILAVLLLNLLIGLSFASTPERAMVDLKWRAGDVAEARQWMDLVTTPKPGEGAVLP